MERNLKKIRLGLFFTEGVSLRTWRDAGFLERELKYYRGLAREVGEVIFFTYGTANDDRCESNIDMEGIVVVSRPVWCPSRIYSFLLPLIQRAKICALDVCKTNQMRGSWTAVLVKYIYKKKLVVRCGYEWLSFLQKRGSLMKAFFVKILEGWVYASADAIILTSEHDKGFVLHTFGRGLKKKIFVVPNYIDTDVFKPIRKGLKREGIVYVGRFSDEKNLKNLIYAIKGVHKKLTLIGDGPQKDELIELAKKEGILLYTPGKIQNERIPEELQKHELCILPSFHEGNPKALLEAMSCGMACVGTSVNGIAEIIKDRENGLLCETSSESINNAIQTVLRDSVLAQRIGKSAREYILENNSLYSVFEREIFIFDKIFF